MKKIISMILVFILGFVLVVGGPKTTQLKTYVSDLPKIIYYLPKKDEVIAYWTSNTI